MAYDEHDTESKGPEKNLEPIHQGKTRGSTTYHHEYRTSPEGYQYLVLPKDPPDLSDRDDRDDYEF